MPLGDAPAANSQCQVGFTKNLPVALASPEQQLSPADVSYSHHAFVAHTGTVGRCERGPMGQVQNQLCKPIQGHAAKPNIMKSPDAFEILTSLGRPTGKRECAFTRAATKDHSLSPVNG